MTALRLHPADVEAVARRVVELLDERERPAPFERMLSVAEKATQLAVSPDYVRQHAEELGGELLPSSGERRTWRFPASPPGGDNDAQPLPPAARPPTPLRRRSHLLPIRGEAA